MAAEDLIGPCVLKLQSRVGFPGNWPVAIPVRSGLPRNMGQSVAEPEQGELSTPPSNSTQMETIFGIMTTLGCLTFGKQNRFSFRSGFRSVAQVGQDLLALGGKHKGEKILGR